MKTIQLSKISLAMALGITILVSCGKDDDAPTVITLPPIGGYANAGEVGAADLLAYWPLDGNGTESKSNTAPATAVGASYEAGAKGQGLKLVDGYLDYPTIPALSASPNSITISVWAKLFNTKLNPTADSHISEIFNISGATPGNGYVSVLAETHRLVTHDTIQVKGRYETTYNNAQSNGDIVNQTKMEPWMISDNAIATNIIKHVAFPNKIGGKWAHIVYVFDGSAAKNMIYVNGVNISNSPWVLRNGGITPFNLTYASTTHPIIGARSNFIAGLATGDVWNKAMTGGVDEIRVWKKALSGPDINFLYELEKAGR